MESVVFENVNNVPGELNRPKEYFLAGANMVSCGGPTSACHPLAFSCAPFRRARIVRTPAFERIAREGVRFTPAFCASPSCTPSRSAVLTGQPIWQIAEAGMLSGTLEDRGASNPSRALARSRSRRAGSRRFCEPPRFRTHLPQSRGRHRAGGDHRPQPPAPAPYAGRGWYRPCTQPRLHRTRVPHVVSARRRHLPDARRAHGRVSLVPKSDLGRLRWHRGRIRSGFRHSPANEIHDLRRIFHLNHRRLPRVSPNIVSRSRCDDG